MMPPVSLIISFYNNIELLSMVFAALENQTYRDFEVIIADDGSTETVGGTIRKMAAAASFSVQHCWHEDEGWRKNRILNRAIRCSKGDYLIFIDGDCIPHRLFIEEHVAYARKGHVLTGRRAQLTEQLTKQLTEQKVVSGAFEQYLTLKLILASLFNKKLHAENAIRIKHPLLRKLFIKDKEKGILGCNFSLYKNDILKVNGFDERFLHPGTGEDTDIDRRLKRAGITTSSKKHLLTLYHIFHKQFDLNDQRNLDLLDENDRNGVTFTPFGIDKESF